MFCNAIILFIVLFCHRFLRVVFEHVFFIVGLDKKFVLTVMLVCKSCCITILSKMMYDIILYIIILSCTFLLASLIKHETVKVLFFLLFGNYRLGIYFKYQINYFVL